MKLTIFQSEKGDCLLLSSGSGAAATHVLVDGGMRRSYRDHVARAVSRLPHLDLVYVSHIDQDHISGVLQLIDDAFDWKLFRLRQKRGDAHPRPESPEPPEIRAVWHNAFHDQVSASAGDVEDMLIATANIASAREELREAAIRNEEYATSIPEALQLSARIGIKQLGLKVNQGRGKLLMAKKKQRPINVGPISFTIIGPFANELRDLNRDGFEIVMLRNATIFGLGSNVWTSAPVALSNTLTEGSRSGAGSYFGPPATCSRVWSIRTSSSVIRVIASIGIMNVVSPRPRKPPEAGRGCSRACCSSSSMRACEAASACSWMTIAWAIRYGAAG